jgi:UDP:flavonoid glycosyltransferase YjiC (YdhE family)
MGEEDTRTRALALLLLLALFSGQALTGAPLVFLNDRGMLHQHFIATMKAASMYSSMLMKSARRSFLQCVRPTMRAVQSHCRSMSSPTSPPCPRILFAWEMGANLGHLTRDLPLARDCRDAGCEVFFAAHDLRAAAPLLAAEGFPLLPAPRPQRSAARHPPPVNFADMLMHEGYGQPEALAAALDAWKGLLQVVCPALLVYNHSPAALLAARQARLPVLLLGTGFEIPPPSTPLPSFRPWENIPDAVLHTTERAWTAAANAVLVPRGMPALRRVSDLFDPADVHLTTFAELDVFGPRPGVHHVGPVFALPPQSGAVQWEGARRRRIVCYLRPGIPGVEALLEALQRSGAEVVCAVPGLPADWPLRFNALRFFPHAVDLSALLPVADVAVTYGAGTIATCLLAGVPVLMVPRVVEQYLAGLALERTGAGLLLREQRTPANCTALIDRLLNEPTWHQAAGAFATAHAGFSMATARRELLDLAMTMAASVPFQGSP